jgi:hypothetical protein
MLTNNPTNQIYHKDEHDVVGLYKTPSHTYPIFKSPKAGWDSATAEMKKLGSLPLVLVLAKHTVGNSGVKYSAVDILKNFGKPGYTYKDLAEHFKTPLTIIKNKFGLASVDISIDRMDKLPGFDPRKMAEAFAQNEGYFAYGNPKVTTDPKKSWGASSNDPRVHSLPAEKIHIDNP